MNSNIEPIMPRNHAAATGTSTAPADSTFNQRVTICIQSTAAKSRNRTASRGYEDALPAGTVREDLVRRVRKLINRNLYDTEARLDAACQAMLQQL